MVSDALRPSTIVFFIGLTIHGNSFDANAVNNEMNDRLIDQVKS